MQSMDSESGVRSLESAVRHVAHLARLDITDAEAKQFTGQLATVLKYMEQLNELDTADVPPTAHPLPVHNVFRDDVVQPTWDSDRALQNAPQRQGAYFCVPKVLDQENA